MGKLAVVLALLPVVMRPAMSAQPVSWWMAHPTELRQVLRLCHDDAAYAQTVTCGNAEAAASGLRAQNAPDLVTLLKDPRYWSANPIARAAELSACKSGTSTFPAACPAVFQSALQALKGQGR